MSFLGFSFSCQTPKAKVADGKLILSLPDAITPAVWVMDLTEATTSVLRIETDKQGFFVLRRHSGKATAEAVGVYRDPRSAARALKIAAKGLYKAREAFLRDGPGGRPVVIRPASRLGRFFTYFVFAWFILHVTGISQAVSDFWSAPMPNEPTIAQQAKPEAKTDTPAQKPTFKAGVPMSADDLLNARHR